MEKTATILRTGVLALAVVSLGIGAVRTHKVYEPGEEFGVRVFDRASDFQLVEWATYGGVYGQDGRLLRHAWAVQQDGKQKCPT